MLGRMIGGRGHLPGTKSVRFSAMRLDASLAGTYVCTSFPVFLARGVQLIIQEPTRNFISCGQGTFQNFLSRFLTVFLPGYYCHEGPGPIIKYSD